MTVLVFGQTGQVGRSLAALKSTAPFELVFLDRAGADLSEPGRCAEIIMTLRPRAVLNAAAWTGVDAAESQEALASLINGEAPGAMARACAALSIPFLHVSTDYVFDGSGTAPWAVDSPPAPLGAYGRSKRLGERRIQESGARALILRTSWVFSPYGSNFVKTMLRLGAERASLTVVDDQVGGATSAASIAHCLLRVTEALLAGAEGGVFHFSGAPDGSWAAFARAIMAAAGLACVVEPIPSSAYPTPAPRPKNSRLDCQALRDRFGISRPDWRADLKDVLKALRDQGYAA